MVRYLIYQGELCLTCCICVNFKIYVFNTQHVYDVMFMFVASNYLTNSYRPGICIYSSGVALRYYGGRKKIIFLKKYFVFFDFHSYSAFQSNIKNICNKICDENKKINEIQCQRCPPDINQIQQSERIRALIGSLLAAAFLQIPCWKIQIESKAS